MQQSGIAAGRGAGRRSESYHAPFRGVFVTTAIGLPPSNHRFSSRGWEGLLFVPKCEELRRAPGCAWHFRRQLVNIQLRGGGCSVEPVPDKKSDYLATATPEVDFALVLARVIDAVNQDPAELRRSI